MEDVRVLVVDDQEPYRRAMAAVVAETEGFTVVAAVTTGEESLDAVAELHPDLVLMDVNLPSLDGIATARGLAARPNAPVVLLLSTYDVDQIDQADIDGSGAAAYLAKAELAPERLSALWRDARGPVHDRG